MSNLVEMYVNGQKFVFWENVQLSRNIDSVGAATFKAPFEHNARGFKNTFRPFGYNEVLIAVNGVTQFTGTMIDVAPNVTADDRSIDVSCYAKCGVLMDCTMPAESMPLEFNNLNLKEIAERMCEPFKLDVEFQGDPGAKFGRVACDPDKKVFEFLTELAKQRSFIISSNASGGLLFWKSGTGGRPVAVLTQGESPLQSVSPDFKPQEFYSDMTGLSPVEVGKPAVKKTVKTKKGDSPKPKVKKPKPAKKYSKFSTETDAGAFRPLVFKIDDAEGADVETATKAALARMLGNMVAYTIEVSTWHDSRGRLWAPNTKIKLKAPDAMVYDYYEFEIKSADFSQNDTEETATLTLALPGSFSGDAPEIFPWEL